MSRLLLFLLLYAIAFFLGFAARARYDEVMLRKPHMQARLRIFAQEVMLYDPDSVPPEEREDLFPPSTIDPMAFNESLAMRAVDERQKELDQALEDQLDAPAAAGDGAELPAEPVEEQEPVEEEPEAFQPAGLGVSYTPQRPIGRRASAARDSVDAALAESLERVSDASVSEEPAPMSPPDPEPPAEPESAPESVGSYPGDRGGPADGATEVWPPVAADQELEPQAASPARGSAAGEDLGPSSGGDAVPPAAAPPPSRTSYPAPPASRSGAPAADAAGEGDPTGPEGGAPARSSEPSTDSSSASGPSRRGGLPPGVA